MSHDWGYDDGFDEFLAEQLERVLRKLSVPTRSERLSTLSEEGHKLRTSDMEQRATPAKIGHMGPKLPTAP